MCIHIAAFSLVLKKYILLSTCYKIFTYIQIYLNLTFRTCFQGFKGLKINKQKLIIFRITGCKADCSDRLSFIGL